MVGDCPELREEITPKLAKGFAPQSIATLPVTINGQISRIEELDQYQFSLPQAGLVTVELTSRKFNSPLHGMLRVKDSAGKTLVDLADTEGRDRPLLDAEARAVDRANAAEGVHNVVHLEETPHSSTISSRRPRMPCGRKTTRPMITRPITISRR